MQISIGLNDSIFKIWKEVFCDLGNDQPLVLPIINSPVCRQAVNND